MHFSPLTLQDITNPTSPDPDHNAQPQQSHANAAYGSELTVHPTLDDILNAASHLPLITLETQ